MTGLASKETLIWWQLQLTFGQELWKYLPQDGIRDSLTWTTPPDESDEDSIAAVRISHLGLFWNRDLVQRYAFPDSSDIFRCFARQEHDCSSAVHPPPHCIIPLIHIQKAVTKEQSFQLQINIVIGLLWLFIDKFLCLFTTSVIRYCWHIPYFHFSG